MELLGWLGAILIIAAYFANSWGYLKADRPLYHVLNAAGASGVALASLVKENWSAAGLNIVWLLIGLLWLARHLWQLKKVG